MKIIRLKTNHLECPLGYDLAHAMLSFCVTEAAGQRQAAARIQVSLSEDPGKLVLDTGLVPCLQDAATGRMLEGIDNLGWELPLTLAPRTRYYWRVFVRTDAGEEGWSDWTWLETAKGDEPWMAKPIASPLGMDVHPLFTRSFMVGKGVDQARLYILGLGMYEAYLDGEKLGEEVLSPGFHTYDTCLQYQTLPLQLTEGTHTLSVMLGDGWYKGRYGLKASAPRYGTDYALLAEMHIHYADGYEELVSTDETWEVRPAPVTMDGIYDGEVFDARMMEEAPVSRAIASPLDMCKVEPRCAPLLRVQEERSCTLCPSCENVLDFGQNMVGWVSFRCDVPRGQMVTLRFAEEVRDGQIYRDNLRSARCCFTYISDGKPRLVRPHFTFFGFRYVSVDGMDIRPECFKGCVIHSDMERTGKVQTSHAGLNRLLENVWWSQRGNFLDIPTDCPQRDERMGWTGDIQVFCDTACFNADCTAFLTKFLKDLRSDQQLLGGSVPCVTPMTGYRLAGVSAWGDAATVVPWQTYVHSGDKRILRNSLKSMCDWVDFITSECEKDGTGCLWTGSPQLGDWLALDGNSVYGGTDRGMLATAYYFYSASLTAKAARVLGESQIAGRYESLARDIARAFQAEYFSSTGRLMVQTQTACAVVLHLDLCPGKEAKERTRALLVRKVLEAGTALETGFVGTPWLLPALSEAGRSDLACALLLREDYPGWLYEIAHGATTIWERWNSMEPDGAMNRDGMNSFNHYAYGSVAAWVYRTLCGIAPDPEVPGFRHILMNPVPNRCLAHAQGSLMTGSGKCTTAWRWEGDVCHLQVCVPFGCIASLTLPGETKARNLPAGCYAFDFTLPQDVPAGLDAPWRALMAKPGTREVIERLFPRAVRGVAFQEQMFTLRQLTTSPFAELTREQIEALDAALKAAQKS